MTKISKTIYIENELLKEIGEGKFTDRINDLIQKGLLYEKNGDKITLRSSIEYLVNYYNTHTTSKPINKLN